MRKMKLTDDLKKNIEIIEKNLNVGNTFDMLARIVDVHNTKFYLYYLDGFIKDTNLEYVRRDMYNLKKENFENFNDSFFSDEVDLSKYKFNISPRKNIQNIKNKSIEFIKNFDNSDSKNLLFTGATGLR